MKLKKDDRLTVNTQLMKMTGLYQMLNPNSVTIFGYNTFKCIAIVEMIIMIIILIALILTTYIFLTDINEVTKYLMFITSNLILFIKLYYVMKHSETIWNSIHFTDINYLSYKYHKRQILEIGWLKSKLLTTIFTCLWLILVACCIFSPFVGEKYYINIKIKNQVYSYRYNVMNLVFQATDQFYNDFFMLYYYVEMTALVIFGHFTLVFDLLVISMCFAYSYKFKTIAYSFNTLDISQTHIPSKK